MGATSYANQSNEPGFAGQPVDARASDIISRVNSGAVAQVSTITVDSASNSTAYTLEFVINGVAVPVTYTSDGTATTAEISAGLQAAIAASPILSSLLSAADDIGDGVTVTAKIANQAFSVSATSGASDLTIATSTAASGAADIYPGRGVVELASSLGNCRLPSTADDTVKVVTVTVGGTFDAADYFTVHLAPAPGFENVFEPITVSANGQTNLETTLQGLQIALNEVLADIGVANSTIAVTDSATTLVFTSQLPNLDFQVTLAVVGDDGNSSGATVTYTDTAALVDLKFLGVAMLDRTRSANSNGDPVFSDGDIVPIMESGVIFAQLDAGITPTIGDPVFLRASASGSEVLGAFRDAQDGADCILIPPSRARWVDSSAYNVNGVRVARLQLFR